MEFNKNTDGEILINGTSTKDGKSAGEILELRKNQQMVFQDPPVPWIRASPSLRSC